MENMGHQAALLNHVALSLNYKIGGTSAKDVYMIFSSIPVRFVFKESEAGSKEQSIYGFFGGKAKYNSLSRDYNIELEIFNSSSERSLDECVALICNSQAKEWVNKKLAFVYLHELQHIFQKHLLYSNKYRQIAQGILSETTNKKIDKKMDVGILLNIAMDFHINSFIKNLSIFNDLYTKSEKIDFLYRADLDSKKMNEVDILKKIINEKSFEAKKIEGTNLIRVQIEIAGENRQFVMPMDIGDEGVLDGVSDEDLKEAFDTAVTRMKSSGVTKLMAELGLPIEIEVNWIDKLESKLNTISYAYSKSSRRNWAKPNYFYKKVSLPGRQSLKNDMELFVTIDYSGSMTKKELRKINFALIKLHNKGFNITLLGHTMKLVFIEKFSRKDNKILEFIKYRRTTGATSHREVFEYLEENVKGEKNIVIIMSDMGSDIQVNWERSTWQNRSKVLFLDTEPKSEKKLKAFAESNGAVYITV